MRDYFLNPIDQRRSGLAQRRSELAKFEVRRRIDQTRHDGNVAQVLRLLPIGLVAHRRDPLTVDRDHAIGERRSVNRKDVTSLQRKTAHECHAGREVVDVDRQADERNV